MTDEARARELVARYERYLRGDACPATQAALLADIVAVFADVRAEEKEAIARRLADLDLATIDATWTPTAREAVGETLIQFGNRLCREAAAIRRGDST